MRRQRRYRATHANAPAGQRVPEMLSMLLAAESWRGQESERCKLCNLRTDTRPCCGGEGYQTISEHAAHAPGRSWAGWWTVFERGAPMKSSCVQTVHCSGRCDVCGERPEDALHLPEKLGGFYCQRHCPICSPVAATADNAAADIMTKTHQRLPPACPRCAPHGGAWAFAPSGGMQRCDCPRGRALAEADARNEHSARWRDRPRRRVVHQPAIRDHDFKLAASGDR